MTSHPCDRGLNCDSLSSGEDVKNNAVVSENKVVVGTRSSYANGFNFHLVHLRTADAVSEWREETHLSPTTRTVCRHSFLLGNSLLGRLEVFGMVAGTGGTMSRAACPGSC